MPKAFYAALLLASGFMIFTVSTTAYAAEAIVRFTRNGQDALIIGEVISKDGDSIAVEPVHYVVSPSSMTPIKEQLHYNSAVIVDMVNTKYYYDSLDVGDYIIASLDKDGDYFKVMWGLYKIDSLDYKTLNVYGGNSDDNEYIKNFLNNGIEYNEQNRADIDELIAIDDFENVKAII